MILLVVLLIIVIICYINFEKEIAEYVEEFIDEEE